MSEALAQVLNQPLYTVEVFRIAANKERAIAFQRGVSSEVIILGSILIILQILDGIFTGIGVNQFGIDAEGNPFIHSLMSHIGYIPALIASKSVAIGIIVYLCSLSNIISWIRGALRGMIGVYLCAAIIPWSAILYTHLT